MSKNVNIAVPFSNTITASQKMYELNVNVYTTGVLSSFKAMNAALGTGQALSPFNYLNNMDFGHFYQVADVTTSKTYMLSYFILSNTDIDPTTFTAYTSAAPLIPASFANFQTGDKLCYGSGT